MRDVLNWISIASLLAANAFGQATHLVSVGPGDVQGDGTSTLPSVSADGRRVAFESDSTNLVTGDTNGRRDAFLRDLTLGTTARVNVSSAGAEADGVPYFVGGPRISADGSCVAFASHATNLVAADTNAVVDVFVHDVSSGITTRVSVDSAGQQGDFGSYEPTISADGRLVAFASDATNLVAGDTNGVIDVFVHDRATGQTRRVSVNSSGVETDGSSRPATISTDGRWVAFGGDGTTLVSGDTNAVKDTFVHEIATGVTTRVSVDPSGVGGNGPSSGWPSISADGRFVAFVSAATNLLPGDTNGQTDVYVRDVRAARTVRATLTSAGLQTFHGVNNPFLSGDGRVVVFQSRSELFDPPDTNSRSDYVVRDLATGLSSRANVTSSGAQTTGDNLTVFTGASVSANERHVAFFSVASDVVPPDVNGRFDVFLRDRFGFDPPVVFCAGDGVGTPCPCGNAGSAWHGCENSFNTGGGLLVATGMPSVSADTLLLAGSGMPPSASALYFQGTAPQGGGLGVAFGDGLRCVGGSVTRLGTKQNVTGNSGYGAPAGDVPISVRGSVPVGGGTFVYQVWYRNTAPGFCAPEGFNLTNGLSVLWLP
jgi:Tol biopolymer transport system component